MGKRKKSTRGKPQKKVKQTLDTQFSCLFCNHEKAVVCSMDKKLGIGNLSCKICGQNFQAPINSLSAPIDVYSEWIDACEAVANQDNTGQRRQSIDDRREEDYNDDEDDDE